LDWADRIDVRADPQAPQAIRRSVAETVVAVIDPNEFPLIAADLAYVRGMAHRQLGEETQAQIWLSKAAIDGVLIETAKQALSDPGLQLVVTDESTINSRTNRWDVTTERSQDIRAEEENKERRADLLAAGRALLDNQVGLAEVKRAVAEIEDQMEVRALRSRARSAGGQPDEPHVAGRPPRARGRRPPPRRWARSTPASGSVRNPEIIEVKRADFCGEHIGASGPENP
jgi:hypothetical protein